MSYAVYYTGRTPKTYARVTVRSEEPALFERLAATVGWHGPAFYMAFMEARGTLAFNCFPYLTLSI